MDIQKEREAFESWIKKEYPEMLELISHSDIKQAYDFSWEVWQAAKAQAVPEGKYILQTFSTYSGVCEDTFNHKNIGVFESIDAAMFHARNIGLVMNHYGYEFRVIEAKEPK